MTEHRARTRARGEGRPARPRQGKSRAVGDRATCTRLPRDFASAAFVRSAQDVSQANLAIRRISPSKMGSEAFVARRRALPGRAHVVHAYRPPLSVQDSSGRSRAVIDHLGGKTKHHVQVALL